MPGEKVRGELHKDATCCFEQYLQAAPYKTGTIRPLTSHLKLSKKYEQDMLSTAGEVRITPVIISNGLLHMDTPVLTDQ